MLFIGLTVLEDYLGATAIQNGNCVGTVDYAILCPCSPLFHQLPWLLIGFWVQFRVLVYHLYSHSCHGVCLFLSIGCD